MLDGYFGIYIDSKCVNGVMTYRERFQSQVTAYQCGTLIIKVRVDKNNIYVVRPFSKF